jgi:enoyl-CoA hydratase/carnithine racemase
MNTFRFEQLEAVGKLILASGESGQADADYAESLRQSVRQANESDIRVLHVTSESGSFSVGDPEQLMTQGSRWFEAFAAEAVSAYHLIEDMRVPTIASVQGAAIGGGFELLLTCDFLVVAETARLHLPEAGLGMVPLAGGVQRLADRVGRARANRLLLLAEPLSGRLAVELGIATHVATADEMQKTVDDLVGRLATGPTVAYGAIRTLLRAWSANGVAGADTVQRQLTSAVLDTQDAQLGLATIAEVAKKGPPFPTLKFAGK